MHALAKGVFQPKCANNDAGQSIWSNIHKPEIKEEKRTWVEDVSASKDSLSDFVVDDFCYTDTHVDESELDTIIPLPSGIGETSTELRLEISCLPSINETLSWNRYLGVSPKMDNYSFSSTKKLVDQRFVVDVNSTSEDMPTADEWCEARVVNLMDKSMISLNVEPECPNLVVLFLQRNKRLTRIPASFFSQMPALSFLDLSHTRIRELPKSLFKLGKLKVLLLRSCLCLDTLPPDIKELMNMEVLDLLGTDVYHIPEEIGDLTRLRHLHLSFFGPEYGTGYARFPAELISADAISKLKALQALSVDVHPEDERWKRTVTNMIKHVGLLENLIYLQFYFPTVEALESFIEVSPSWKEQRLQRFKLIAGQNIKRIISRVPDEVESIYDQHERCLKFVNGEQVPEVMKTVLKNVTAFYLDHHSEARSLSDFGVSNFQELKFCIVRECPNMQNIGDNAAFPNLEYLGLHYLWKLERIWEGPVPPGCFKAVKYLRVATCPVLEYIASRSTLQSLSKLETFIIEDCGSLKSVVELEENETVKYDDDPLLPRLTKLVLRHLPQLIAIGCGLFQSNKTDIDIHCCPNLPKKPGLSRRKVLVHHITAATSAFWTKLEDKISVRSARAAEFCRINSTNASR